MVTHFLVKVNRSASSVHLIKITSVDVNSACLSESLGDKGLFSAANILQIVDVVRRVVRLAVHAVF